MIIYHLPSYKVTTFTKAEDGTYKPYKPYFGHIITVADNRTDERFAHLFSPDGTRVHHLNYITFKAIADNLPHKYLGLSKDDFKVVKQKLKQATSYQLSHFRNVIDAELFKLGFDEEEEKW
jgi:hypothetical protein